MIDKKGIFKNIYGFHHDFLGTLENSGLVEFRNKVFGKAGAYRVEIWKNGKRMPKTFFPSYWSREKIIREVYRAYDQFVMEYNNGKGLAKLIENKVYEYTRDNKYRIIVEAAEGLEVEIYLTKKGVVKSFYPLVT